MLVVSNARKTFHAGTPDERRALAGIDVRLEEGDFCIVIGSNGAGKSTLLNAVAGKQRLDSGTVSIDGEDVSGLPVHRRARFIARVFQDPMVGTAPSMTIAENLLLAELRGKPARLKRGLTRERRQAYRDRLASLGLDLERRLDAPVASLSGGQRQSLALLMAVSTNPRLLLLDEHTAALDPRTADAVMRATVEAISEHRLTALMVTHNMSHAVSYGNRLIMMDQGAIHLEIAGPEKKRVTINDLISRFHVKSDRMVLQA
jgi:putative tryptophan/tyrosine transport system ATP-binding protein